MLKQQDMTETAAAVLHFLPADKWVTPPHDDGKYRSKRSPVPVNTDSVSYGGAGAG